MKCAQGRKGVHFFRISKTGVLCQVSFDGGKRKLIDVTGRRCLGSERILTKKNYSLGVRHFRIL